ncbi:MAG: hypothetical protein JWN36_2475 [Microbacteriaceae bacterium]|nr:hypothetical protein [Microbacteriaceae bacterium]
MAQVDDEDAEALTWGTERDTTHVEAPEAPAEVEEAEEDEPHQTGSALLVAYGVFAGAYVLFIAGWLVSVTNTEVPVVDILPTVMYRLGQVLAAASPLLWFGGVLVLTRRVRSRVLWLLLGLLVVAPWPFILGGIK